MSKLSVAVVVFLTLVVGIFIGTQITQNDVINEMESWHVARFYEDGSWNVEYKDGTKDSGCVDNGLCQD